MANDNNVNVNLFLTHLFLKELKTTKRSANSTTKTVHKYDLTKTKRKKKSQKYYYLQRMKNRLADSTKKAMHKYESKVRKAKQFCQQHTNKRIHNPGQKFNIKM
jgi:hypothetical protein